MEQHQATPSIIRNAPPVRGQCCFHASWKINPSRHPLTRPALTGRRQLAEYLLRAPFSLEKITWVEKTKRVIYRSDPNWRTKRNFEVFTATDFLAAAVEHIPPKNRHIVRYSNKCRGMEVQPWRDSSGSDQPPAVRAGSGTAKSSAARAG